MTQHALSKAEADRTRKAWDKAHGVSKLAAEMLGIPASTMYNRKRILGLVTPEITSAPLREVQRKADETAALKKQVKELLREQNDADDIRQAVFGLAKQDTTPPDWMLRQPKKGQNLQIPLLAFSDFHDGEYIAAGELDGINAYTPAIAAARYRKMIEKTILLAKHHMPGATYPGIIYWRGGDLVAGDIHDLKETNSLKAIPAVRHLVSLERWGLAQLAKAFGNVRVITVPGNHGRDSDKPHSKENAARNFDVLAGHMLELSFGKYTAANAWVPDPRFKFWTPESGDALFSVFGHTVAATHGDRIGAGGGQGQIGPVAPFVRGAKRLRAYYAQLGHPVDYVLMGHLHTEMDIDGNFCNGCGCGYSQYGKQFRFLPRPATQWLLFFDQPHGITARWSLQLSDKPAIRSASVFEEIN